VNLITSREDNFAVIKERFMTEGPKSILANGDKEERADSNPNKALNESKQIFIEVQHSDKVVSIAFIMAISSDV